MFLNCCRGSLRICGEPLGLQISLPVQLATVGANLPLQLPAGTPIGRVTVAITPADETAPTGRRLLAKLLVLQAAIPMAEGLSQEQIDAALERERASWR